MNANYLPIGPVKVIETTYTWPFKAACTVPGCAFVASARRRGVELEALGQHLATAHWPGWAEMKEER